MSPAGSDLPHIPAAAPDQGPVFRVAFRVADWEAYAGPALADKTAWTRWALGETGAWPPGKTPVAPVSAMPALLRRRADPADRLALEIAFRLAPPGGGPTVFASRHGQVTRSVAMLQAQASGEGASPMDFSLSVHNAAAGQYAIAHGDRHASTSLSARDEAFGSALLEAAGLLAEGAGEVLVIASDPCMPEVFGGRTGGSGAIDGTRGEPGGYALGLRLRADGGEPFACALERRPGPDDGDPQALAFLRALAGGGARADWSRGGRHWSWERG